MPTCADNLTHIAAEQCPTRPGLKSKFWLAQTDALTAIGAATNHEVSTITAASGDGFYALNGSRKDTDQKSTPDENGGYTTEVKFFLSRQTAAKHLNLSGLNGVEAFVAITEDLNGQKEIIGSLTEPAMVMVEATKIPKNGYNVTIKWENHADLPYIFTGSVPLHS